MENFLQNHWVKAAKKELYEIAFKSNNISYHDFWDRCVEIIKSFHRFSSSSIRTCELTSQLTDLLIVHMFEVALLKYEEQYGHWRFPISLLALGAYGRCELCPVSEIDIIWLHPHKLRKEVINHLNKYLNEVLVQPLLDLNFRIRSETKTIQECIHEGKQSFRMLNAQLDARLLAGNQRFFNHFLTTYHRFYTDYTLDEFVERCAISQQLRHQRCGGTVFLQEPNLKNGVGGIRDYRNILWLARAAYGEANLSVLTKHGVLSQDEQECLEHANECLTKARIELHFQTQRSSDLLYLEQQLHVAKNLGYDSIDQFESTEHFMHDLYMHANNIHLINEALIERFTVICHEASQNTWLHLISSLLKPSSGKHIDGFILSNGLFSAENHFVFKEDPIRLIRIFRHCQQFHAKLHPNLKLLIKESLDLIDSHVVESSDAAKAFKTILESVGEVSPILIEMHELGVLSNYIPEFAQISYLIQHEYYHQYTADVHTLNTIKRLDQIFDGVLPEITSYTSAIRSTTRPALLYWMLFLHDLGKAHGLRSSLEIAKIILNRMDVTPRQQELILFAIQNSLLMYKTWQRFDIDDPNVIYAFASSFDDPELLDYLYVMTYCDAWATNEELWNSYKEMLHQKLYLNTLAVYEEQNIHTSEERKRRKKNVYMQILKKQKPKLSQEDIEEAVSWHPDRYFMLSSDEEIFLHFQLIEKLQSNISRADCAGSLMPEIDWKHDINQSLTVVTLVTWDRPGLFASFSGAFAASGLNVVAAKAFTRSDKIVIDTFYVTEANNVKDSVKNLKQIFEKKLKNIVVDDEDPMPDIIPNAKIALKTSSGYQIPDIYSSINVYHELDLKRTIVEIECKDQVGLLYQLAKTITDHGFDITFAKVSTEHGVVVDVFHIQRSSMEELTGTHELIRLRESLNTVLQKNLVK